MGKKKGGTHVKRNAPSLRGKPIVRARAVPPVVNFYAYALDASVEGNEGILRQRAERVSSLDERAEYGGSLHWGEQGAPDESLANAVRRVIWTNEHDPNCLGIAATQVGLRKRFFTVRDNERKVHLFVNPTVEPVEGAMRISEYEGCFSLPDRKVRVERYSAVLVRGANIAGERVELKLTGRAARAAQHEMDHLDGVLIDSYGETEPVGGDVIATGETLPDADLFTMLEAMRDA